MAKPTKAGCGIASKELSERRKGSMQISDELAERLETLARLKGVNQTEIVKQALDRFLCEKGTPADESPLMGRLHSIKDQLNRIERNLRIVNEVAALHVRYHLTVTPPLPQLEQRAACRLGFERFKVLAEQVCRRVEQDQSLIRETTSRLGATECEDLEHDVEIRVTSAAVAPDEHANVALKTESEPAAVAQEGDGNGNFRAGLQSPFC
ncbi:ribbon-helix-helix protein, CopG family [Bradyrhizobium genosp. P]|uniref:ribbon-helix-helix protein, CopG family n=1 Tax=Bradyrhizobium genosp. P TaxID=83641 RepID=UPI003CE758BA